MKRYLLFSYEMWIDNEDQYGWGSFVGDFDSIEDIREVITDYEEVEKSSDLLDHYHVVDTETKEIVARWDVLSNQEFPRHLKVFDVEYHGKFGHSIEDAERIQRCKCSDGENP